MRDLDRMDILRSFKLVHLHRHNSPSPINLSPQLDILGSIKLVSKHCCRNIFRRLWAHLWLRAHAHHPQRAHLHHGATAVTICAFDEVPPCRLP